MGHVSPLRKSRQRNSHFARWQATKLHILNQLSSVLNPKAPTTVRPKMHRQFRAKAFKLCMKRTTGVGIFSHSSSWLSLHEHNVPKSILTISSTCIKPPRLRLILQGRKQFFRGVWSWRSRPFQVLIRTPPEHFIPTNTMHGVIGAKSGRSTLPGKALRRTRVPSP